MKGPYDDILYYAYTGSRNPKRMSMTERGAQFSPFAALTGYDAAIQETGRLTDRQIELDTDARSALDEKLRLLTQHQQDAPEVTVTYFLPDSRKKGGRYETLTATVQKVDVHRQVLIMREGSTVPFSAIGQLQGELFAQLEGHSCWE